MKRPLLVLVSALAALTAVWFTALGAMACYGALTGADNPVSQMRDMMGGMHGGMGGMMAGGDNTSNAPLSIGGMDESVATRDFAFSPGNLQVPVGARVTWTNYDDAPHTATADGGAWDTGTLTRGQRASIAFDRAGAYAYYCTVHPAMKARIVVQ